MKPVRYYLRNRQVECLARDLLKKQGYLVVRSAGTNAPVDLVAWNGDDSLLFVRTGRTRSSFTNPMALVTARFRHEVDTLRRLPRLPYLTVQLWVFFDHQGWRFFEVFPGGVVEVDGNVA
jgi:hypothetical protein